MKNKVLITGALLAAGLISQASAQNVIYLTGSTAFRSVVFTMLNNPGVLAGGNFTLQAARGGSHANGDNGSYMLFHSASYNGVETFIDCVWSGSEAGIASVAQPGGNPVNFLLTGVTGISSSQPTSSETNSTAQAPDLCMADTSQAVSLTQTPSLTPMGTNAQAGAVGVVPFTWMKGVQTAPLADWTSITNVSMPQVRRLFASPVFPALFTGVDAQTNHYIYLVGRNSYSGTHVNTILDNYEPVSLTVQQFSIGGFPHSTVGPVIAGVDPNALDTTVPATDNGYDSGGDVANALSCTGSETANDPNTGLTGWIALGYLGMGDAGTANGNGAQYLSFNGVFESDGAVEEGAYSYWGTEHEYGRNNIGSGFQATFGNDLANHFTDKLGGGTKTARSSGIAFKFMHAGKTSDVSDPFHFGQAF